VSDIQPTTPLLPADALAGKRIGISVSDSADLAQLGLTNAHFKLALRELARTVLVGGGTLAYGGHLIAGGYAEFFIGELGQYSRVGLFAKVEATQDVPMLVCLSQQEHRHCSLEELDRADVALGVHGELRCIDLEGEPIADRSAGRAAGGEPYPTDRATLARGMTALRLHLARNTSARVLVGGRRSGYFGSMPGVMEEALMALRAEQPLYLAAGLGGATLDMARAIDPRCESLCPQQPGATPLDAGTLVALDTLRELVRPEGWKRLRNGLDATENLHLASTHRPSEIAALVALGLGRVARDEASAAG
jgi:hypothetical protein